MKLGFCGDDCDECPRYVGNNGGDRERLKEVALLWQKCGLRKTVLQPEDILCTGCSPENRCTFDIAECATARKVSSCGECADYPCGRNKESFDATEQFAARCKGICSADEYETLDKAFFRKKANLDAAKRRR